LPKNFGSFEFDCKSWVDENHEKVPCENKIGKAFGYFKSEYEPLVAYLRDGRLEIDSGFVERCIRKFAIGRNNWMFSDTQVGAESSSVLYSLVVTAKVNGVNPYRALKYLFEQIPKSSDAEQIEALADIIVAAQWRYRPQTQNPVFRCSDGTSHLLFSGLEFMEKLAALVPQPRIHLTRYFGVLAPHSKLRSKVVPNEDEPSNVTQDGAGKQNG
jgi:hypothetical protein